MAASESGWRRVLGAEPFNGMLPGAPHNLQREVVVSRISQWTGWALTRRCAG